MRTFFLLTLFLLCFSGCEKWLLKPDDGNLSGSQVFEEAWTKMENHYCFFEEKKMNWDSLHQVFYPQTENIAPYSDSLFTVLSKLLNCLQDGHVNLYAGFNFSRNWDWYTRYPANFDENILQRNYWKQAEYTGPFLHTWLNDSVAYIYVKSFETDFGTGALDYVIGKYSNAKGIILDIRHNEGGLLSSAIALASRFTNQSIDVGTLYEKKSKDSYYSPQAIRLSGQNLIHYTGKTALLTNRKVYSSAQFFTHFMRQFPQTIQIGDTTGGGGALPLSHELSNGWVMRFSSISFKDMQGNTIENGIYPQIPTHNTSQAYLAGKDAIIEKALEVLSN